MSRQSEIRAALDGGFAVSDEDSEYLLDRLEAAVRYAQHDPLCHARIKTLCVCKHYDTQHFDHSDTACAHCACKKFTNHDCTCGFEQFLKESQ